MDIQDYASQSRLPLEAFKWMVKKAVINNPLTTDDLAGLKLVEQIWGSSELLRAQIKRFSKVDRKKLIDTCEFATKWEAFAHTRISNLKNGERITMKQLISEIELNYELTVDYHMRKRLYRIREKVYNHRRYIKKKNESE